jgi:hypothetical protein
MVVYTCGIIKLNVLKLNKNLIEKWIKRQKHPFCKELI